MTSPDAACWQNELTVLLRAIETMNDSIKLVQWRPKNIKLDTCTDTLHSHTIELKLPTRTLVSDQI